MVSRYTYPDWGSKAGALGAPVSDLAELAARLHSPAALRRTGNVVLIDNFSNNYGWYIQPPYTGNYDIVNYGIGTYAMRGYSMGRLTPGGGPNYETLLTRNFALLPSRLISIEVSMSPYYALPSVPSMTYLQILWGNGTIGYYARFIADWINSVLNIIDDGGTPKQVGSFIPIGNTNTWYNIKLSADFIGGKYVYALFNEQIIDLSQNLLPSSSVTNLYLSLYHKANNGPHPLYMNDFILTFDEQ